MYLTWYLTAQIASLELENNAQNTSIMLSASFLARIKTGNPKLVCYILPRVARFRKKKLTGIENNSSCLPKLVSDVSTVETDYQEHASTNHACLECPEDYFSQRFSTQKTDSAECGNPKPSLVHW